MNMAGTGSPFVRTMNSSPGFTAVLTSAACEWILMFLLLLDAVFSYLLTKFASYCKLQAPCILCSRLDHLLGNEKPEFYQQLLCSNHRSELSSLICCHIHGKLADGSRMCEECLLSFAIKNKSSPEMHRLLVRILGMDLVGYGFQIPLLNNDFISDSMGTKFCSCCNKCWRSRKDDQKQLQPKTFGTGVEVSHIRLPHFPSHRHRHLKRLDRLKKRRKKFCGSEGSCDLRSSAFDPLVDVGYSELKRTSDSESEVPFSEEDDDSSKISGKFEAKDDFAVPCASGFPTRTLSKGLDPKLPNHLYDLRPSVLDPCFQPDVSQPQDTKSLVSSVVTDHLLGELNWEEVNQNSGPFALPELISIDDIPPLVNAMEVPCGEPKESTLMLPHYQSYESSALAELVSLDDSLPSVGVSPEKSDIAATSLDVHVSANDLAGELNLISTTSGESVAADHNVNGPAVIKPMHLGQGDWCKWAVSCEKREASDLVAEQATWREPDIVNEELKLLPSHDSSVKQIDLSATSISPIVPGRGDEKWIIATAGSDKTQRLQKSVSVESGLESWDGSLSEIEGESLLDSLKRQIEHDRKCMRALYKDLEEERNASAIAANQAMAMITRLQEEKAALHMEALHYLRMMEEQAEYDVEALEKANDLLAEKEEQIQDLESKLELCGFNFPNDSMEEVTHHVRSDLRLENMFLENSSVPSITNCENNFCYSMRTEVSKSSDKPFVAETPCLEFEDEKLYVSQCLKNIEMKLRQISLDRTLSDMPNSEHNSEHSEKLIDGRNVWAESPNGKGNQPNGQMEENGLHLENDLKLSNGSHICHDGSTGSNGDDHSGCKDDTFFNSNGQKYSTHERGIDLIALKKEISGLCYRLGALEADHEFLEHSLNSLQNGKEGLQFVQDIAHQLQELRKIGIRLSCQSVP